MSDPVPLKKAVPKPQQPVLTTTDTRETLQATHTSELVIALCGPIGSPIHDVAKTIKNVLDSDFGYEKCEIVRLSDIIREYSPGATISEDDEHARIVELIRLGDVLRQKHGNGVLVELAIGKKIAKEREARKAGSGATSYQPARVCHIIDSIKNQEELELLREVYGDMLYFVGVFAPLDARQQDLQNRNINSPKIHELIDKDAREEDDYGQTVRDTFPQADFFLRIDEATTSQIREKVKRFLNLIQGTEIVTPTKAEKAMYEAATAAANSACMSRQVGAALTDKEGEILATGWNDVPKFGGNLYTTKERSDDQDKRCFNLPGGKCFNDEEKKLTAELVVIDLIKSGFIDASRKNAAIDQVYGNSKLKTLIEFSRSVHAEMHAIICGSQAAGKARVQGGKLYATTYPCHACARHIVAAGIIEVYYIEPYRKSLAIKLHNDSISEKESETTKVRILPYDGVAPNKYLKLFREVPNTRKDNGKLVTVNPRTSRPRFDNSLESLPAREGVVTKLLEKKNLINPPTQSQ